MCNVEDDVFHHFISCKNIKDVWSHLQKSTNNQIIGLQKCLHYKDVLIARKAIQNFNFDKLGKVGTIFEFEKQSRS